MDLLQQIPIPMLTPSARLFSCISIKVNYSSRMLSHANYLRIPVLQVFTWQRPGREVCSAQVHLTGHYKVVVQHISAVVSAAQTCSCLKSNPEDRLVLQKEQILKHSEMKTLICNIYLFTYSNCFQRYIFCHCRIYATSLLFSVNICLELLGRKKNPKHSYSFWLVISFRYSSNEAA